MLWIIVRLFLRVRIPTRECPGAAFGYLVSGAPERLYWSTMILDPLNTWASFGKSHDRGGPLGLQILSGTLDGGCGLSGDHSEPLRHLDL